MYPQNKAAPPPLIKPCELDMIIHSQVHMHMQVKPINEICLKLRRICWVLPMRVMASLSRLFEP